MARRELDVRGATRAPTRAIYQEITNIVDEFPQGGGPQKRQTWRRCYDGVELTWLLWLSLVG